MGPQHSGQLGSSQGLATAPGGKLRVVAGGLVFGSIGAGNIPSGNGEGLVGVEFNDGFEASPPWAELPFGGAVYCPSASPLPPRTIQRANGHTSDRFMVGLALASSSRCADHSPVRAETVSRDCHTGIGRGWKEQFLQIRSGVFSRIRRHGRIPPFGRRCAVRRIGQ